MRKPVQAWRRLPTPARFLLAHGVAGFGLSGVFMAALMMAGPPGVADLLLNAEGHWWPVVALWFFVGSTFGAVQIGVATMLLEKPDGRPRRGGGAPALPEPALVRVRARR